MMWHGSVKLFGGMVVWYIARRLVDKARNNRQDWLETCVGPWSATTHRLKSARRRLELNLQRVSTFEYPLLSLTFHSLMCSIFMPCSLQTLFISNATGTSCGDRKWCYRGSCVADPKAPSFRGCYDTLLTT